MNKVFQKILLLRESPVGMVGAGIVFVYVFLSLFASLIVPYDPNQSFVPYVEPFQFAGEQFFLFGTDHLGRDIFSRVVYGGQRVFIYATVATLSAYVVGVCMGLLAGYLRGWWDEFLSFIANVILSFPIMVLYVLVITKTRDLGSDLAALNIVFAVIFASSPGIMRIVRGLVLDIRTKDYIAAAQTRGEPLGYILFAEILPNVRNPLIVDLCLRMGYTTITIGALGFLGLGLPPPDPDWGGMISETRMFLMGGFPHMTVIPALALTFLVLGFNLLSDGIREISVRD